ncbi:putative lipid-transfer protein DIR1 [Carex littledalei]|uniref:Putative lipid-transfer protein DIR1 n=1 Tax=Carex littledalei TaxID=544730 RepID=A0A833R9I5_9POAL|nr:putative lipid-transfer protein DIR1 [Carex littledalei]
MALLSFPKLAIVMVLLSCLMMSHNAVSALSFCRVNDEGIEACLPAVRGTHPPPPTDKCCSNVKTADLNCLCSYQHSYLIPLLGVNVAQVKKLPAKCGINGPNC